MTVDRRTAVISAIQHDETPLCPYTFERDRGSDIAKRLAAHMRKGGGHILAGAKALQPETPTENAAAVLEEFVALGEPCAN